MDDLSQWRLVDTYTVVEVTALILGISPNDAILESSMLRKSDQPHYI